MSHLQSIEDKNSAKFKDLLDLSQYYVNYLEEEAQNIDALIELNKLKNTLRDRGCLSE
jgi:hypothetical protein